MDLLEAYEQSVVAAERLWECAKIYEYQARQNYYAKLERYMLEMPEEQLAQFVAKNFLLCMIISTVRTSDSDLLYGEAVEDSYGMETYLDFSSNSLAKHLEHFFPEDELKGELKKRIQVLRFLFSYLNIELYDLHEWSCSVNLTKQVKVDLSILEQSNGTESYFFNPRHLDFYKRIDELMQKRLKDMILDNRSFGVMLCSVLYFFDLDTPCLDDFAEKLGGEEVDLVFLKEALEELYELGQKEGAIS